MTKKTIQNKTIDGEISIDNDVLHMSVGGKGSVRRKKKAAHKATTTDDKRLQNTLKRIGVNNIPGIEEVNIFKEDSVIHFINPKVQASIQANTYVVSGTPQIKSLQELLPGIINQLGPDSVPYIQKLSQQFQNAQSGVSMGNAVADDDGDDGTNSQCTYCSQIFCTKEVVEV